MLFPCGRSTKVDFASRRQTTLADAPALHFSPVEFRTSKSDRQYFNVTRLLAAKDAYGNLGCPFAHFEHRDLRAANDLTAEECIGVAENGRVGDGMKPCQRSTLFMRHTRSIDDHKLPEDRGFWRKGSGVFQYVFKR